MTNMNEEQPIVDESTLITGAPGHDQPPDEPSELAQDDDIAPPSIKGASDEHLLGLPVAFEVYLPQIMISIDMVRNMARGTTIPLGVDLTEPMRITVNGQTFGHGRFVQIGDKVGIQIEEWKPARAN